MEGLIRKKVRFKDNDENARSDMLVDLNVKQAISWKDKPVGYSSMLLGMD